MYLVHIWDLGNIQGSSLIMSTRGRVTHNIYDQHKNQDQKYFVSLFLVVNDTPRGGGGSGSKGKRKRGRNKREMRTKTFMTTTRNISNTILCKDQENRTNNTMNIHPNSSQSAIRHEHLMSIGGLKKRIDSSKVMSLWKSQGRRGAQNRIIVGKELFLELKKDESNEDLILVLNPLFVTRKAKFKTIAI